MRKRAIAPRMPFEEAVDVSLLLAADLSRHEGEIRAIDAGVPGTYEAFIKLTMAARALRFTHMQVANVQAVEGNAKLPETMVEQATSSGSGCRW